MKYIILSYYLMKNKTTRVVGKISFILVQVFLDNGCMSLTNVQLELEKHYMESCSYGLCQNLMDTKT